ncbi:hypothetical protein DSM107010_68200 [Chroococcidiopsis cubana SAG 39.79]|uniref:Uncharacterized protein n=1 Tax=Chroococcidiopsis cubana SAG 39.79 TaxID=388085 RepID=A0AB37U8I8_9CYAN|nr:hypothetical protein DSM107010_68200 [Chroococcidiopsis cubana SAG 39.79]
MGIYFRYSSDSLFTIASKSYYYEFGRFTRSRQEHYKEELEYFLKTGKQTGFSAPNDAKRLNKTR